MDEGLIEFEDDVINEISIRDRLELFAPEIINMIIEEHGDIDSYIDNIENKEAVDRILEVLSARSVREQKVILLRFGLIDGTPKTLEEVAQIFGVTRERIRQIESKALRHHVHRHQNLADFLNNQAEKVQQMVRNNGL